MCDWGKVEGLSSSDEWWTSWFPPAGHKRRPRVLVLSERTHSEGSGLRARGGQYYEAINALLFPRFDPYLISSAETVSPPPRVMILFKTSLLICAVTGLTDPSQKAKLTRPGCLLAQ